MFYLDFNGAEGRLGKGLCAVNLGRDASSKAALLDGVSHQHSQQSEHSAQSGQKAVGALAQTAQAQTHVFEQVRSTESEHTEHPGLQDTRETCKPQTCQAMPADEGAGRQRSGAH